MSTYSKNKTLVRCLLSAFTLATSTFTASAAVEAVQIKLDGGPEGSLYGVPSGKVLIIEHVIFSDYWDSQDEDKRIILRHGGTQTTGPVWNTSQNYSSNWNQLLRPLRLPEGTAIAAPFLDNGIFKVFIYGRLVDEEDLFAKIDTNIKDVGVKNEGEVKTLLGTVDLVNERPAKVVVEQSSDLESWSAVADLPHTTSNAFSFAISSEDPKQFVRANARALPEEDLQPFPIFIVLPGI